METQKTRLDLSDASSLTVAKTVCRLLSEKLSLSVKLIFAGESALTDYYVVGYGRSSTHVRALANDVEDGLAAAGVYARRTEGLDTADWVLVDFGDVILHVFGKEASEFYRFERLFKPEAFLHIDDVCEVQKNENTKRMNES
ncbi:MAG: ribosome silencing factor [Ruminococcaceae bacterium]|nr:ribosome silencing factor [Oscillospiraceae bacterium]